ncbi:hypothetical protein ACVMHZ_009545 [Bradyrhizobium liaoningense]
MLARSNYSDVQELQNKKRQIESRIRDLQKARSDGGQNLPDDDFQVRTEQARLDKISAELSRKLEVGEIRGAKNQTLLRLAGACDAWLRSGRPGGTAVVQYDGKLPELKEGADILAAIEDRRLRLRELAAERHRVDSACFPSAARKTAMVVEVEEWAELGKPNAVSSIEHGAPISWPLTMHRFDVHNAGPGAIAFGHLTDVRNFMAWWDMPGMIARLSAETDEVSDNGASMSEVERAKALATIAADYLATERAEALAVWTAQSRGMAVSHREDCDVRALLGLDLVIAKTPLPSDSGSHVTKYVGAPR